MTVTNKYYQTLVLNSATQQNLVIHANVGIYPTSGDGVLGTAGYTWTTTNLGTVRATAGAGVDLTAGGFITNGQSGSLAGLISGSGNGVEIDGSSGTVINFATITGGSSGDGVSLGTGSSGTVNNTGLIAGGLVGLAASGATVVNSGTIAGGTTAGVSLASGTNAGTLTNMGTITASGVGVSGGMVTNSGRIVGATGVAAGYIISGGSTIGAPVVNTGTIIGTSGAAVVFTPTVAETITNYGTIGSGTAGTAVKFGAGADVLVIGTSAAVLGTLSGFTKSDTIDLAHTNATSAVFSGNSAGGTLTVMNGGTTVDTFVIAGTLSANVFAVGTDGHGGSDITVAQPTGHTISGRYYLTSPVLLSNPATQNPITVASTGLLYVTQSNAVLGTSGFAWTLSNLGTIFDDLGGSGVSLTSGGIVTNGASGSAGAVIEGSRSSGASAGVAIGATRGTVVNFGTIINGSTDTITYLGGSIILYAGGFITNLGTLLGRVNAPGNTTVVNSGVIDGGMGVYLSTGSNGGTLTNSGLIKAGGGRTAVSANSIINSGTITGVGAGVSLGNGTNVGTLNNSGTITATGVAVSGGGLTNSASGKITGATGVVAGYVTVSGTKHGAPIVNYGTIIGTSGPALAFYSGNFTETVTNYGTIGAGAAGTAVKFGGGADILAIEPTAVVAGTLTGFTQFDTIDLAQTTASGYTFSGSLAGGTLTVTNSGTIVDALVFGALVSTAFTLSSDGHGGTDIKNKLPTGPVISAEYSIGIVLNNPLTQNPFTVSSSGLVSVAGGDAVFGTGYPWILSNLGTIVESFYIGHGVHLTAGGLVTNGQSGASSGLISGSVGSYRSGFYRYGGVEIDGASGTVINFGTVAGGGIGSYGVLLGGSNGTVINSGTITDNINNSVFSGDGAVLGSGMVINSGMITAGGSGAVGLKLGGGRVVNSGMITARALGVGASSATVINSGTISGTSTGGVSLASGQNPGSLSNSGIILATGSGYGVSGGVVTNLASGKITGAIGIIAGWSYNNYGTKIGAPIVNYGTITGFNGAGVAFYKGTLTETITNFGTIKGTGIATAVAFGGGADVLVLGTASVVTGTLTGFTEFDAIDLAHTTATGAVFAGNTAGGTLTVTNSGTIVDTFLLAGRFAATEFTTSPDGAGGTDITLKQPGSIASGTYFQTVILSNPTAQNPFTLQSAGLVSVASGDAILGTSGFAWTVTNLGTVRATGGTGVHLLAGGVIANGQSLSLAGLISGLSAGVAIYGSSGTVVNFATITGGTSGDGVSLGTASSGTVINSGLITGGAVGLAASGAMVINSGTITGGSTAGVTLASGKNAGTLTNSGTISASGVGVSGGMVTNSGRIVGATGVAAGYIISGGSTIGAPVVNTGTIVGTSGAAVAFTPTLAETIANYGTIGGGTASTAVKFGAGADVLVIGPTAVVSGTLTGFTKLDTIDLAKTIATGATFSGNSAGGTLTVMNGVTVIDTFVLAGTLSANVFAVHSDGNGGVDVAIKQPLGNIIGGTYGYTIVLTSETLTTVTAAGRITAPSGPGVVNAVGVVGTLTNLGTVKATGNSGQGVYLSQGGTVANTISGTAVGYISGAGAGVLIGGTGTVMNAATIRGGVGVVAATGATVTVTNAGTIVGTSGTAVSLAGGTSRLIVDPGATFTGTLYGGGGNSVLEIAASGSGSSGSGGAFGAAGAIAYVSLGSVVNFSALQVDASATLGSLGVLSFATLINQGQINIASGDSLAVGTVATAASTGVIDLRTGGTVTFRGAVHNQTLYFHPPGGTAVIEQPNEFYGTITGFTVGDTIDLTGFVAADKSFANNALVLTNSVSNSVTLDIQGSFSTGGFVIASDGVAGTDVTVACFLRGTLIRTETGVVAVEDLAIGGKVIASSGAARPVKWVGQRTYDGRFVAGNRAVLPICIAAGALAEGMPARDLWVSPEHAIYIDGVLVPAGLLANGATIRQVDSVERVEYFHIELDTHDIIFAEGAPAETFLDCGNRFMFQNGGEFAALYPDDRPEPWEFCAPRLEAGSTELAAIRAALLDRAEKLGHALDRDPDLHLIVDGGTIWPASIAGDRYRFHIPAGSAVVWLASRSAVPAEVEAAGCDHRRLGVPVERIALFDAERSIKGWHSDAALSDGFHADEGSHRWTNGMAHLPVSWLRSFPGAFTLEVRLTASGLAYRLSPLDRAIAAAA